MSNREAVRAALIDFLRPRSFKPVEDIPDDTDIYDGLRINGTDLAEIFEWAAATYGADFSSVRQRTTTSMSHRAECSARSPSSP